MVRGLDKVRRRLKVMDQHGPIPGREAFQKLLYFAQLLGWPSDCPFRLHFYGRIRRKPIVRSSYSRRVARWSPAHTGQRGALDYQVPHDVARCQMNARGKKHEQKSAKNSRLLRGA
jgi:hypothetical protein